ncbi:MAG TPA: zinc finger domain-containing protein [Actinomycetospora sp.]|uniref:zinc finger domain-containing protein n=1 Tax=Actinomycetospora sp. TaxID=1872135 RepID=UPI002F3EF9F0
MSDSPTVPPRVPATICHTCTGDGQVRTRHASISRVTDTVSRVCPDCEGSGRLRGFVPPE